MTAGKLIEVLKTFDAGVPVVVEWDDGWANLDSFEFQKDDKENPVIVFDCNEYGTYRLDRE